MRLARTVFTTLQRRTCQRLYSNEGGSHSDNKIPKALWSKLRQSIAREKLANRPIPTHVGGIECPGYTEKRRRHEFLGIDLMDTWDELKVTTTTTTQSQTDAHGRSAQLTHVDERGGARMVDVGDKQTTWRQASAEGIVYVGATALRLLASNALQKGDALRVAQIAGIMAAKQTSRLIPLCHMIPLDDVQVELWLDAGAVRVRSSVRCSARTGVEMEALTAVSVACLTVYDMCKAVDKSITIDGIRLLSKTGGKSDFCAQKN